MSATNIRALNGTQPGSTIYVIASGASLNYVNLNGFDDVHVVTINEMFRHVSFSGIGFGEHFALMHHHEHVQEAIDSGCRVVTSEYDCGISTWATHAFRGDYYTYKTADNTLSLTPAIDLRPILEQRDDELVISPCTVAEGVHFAAHLGASTIILCGADGGSLDGQYNLGGYNGGAGTNPQHIRITQHLLLEVVQAIRAQGVNVYSLNPFVDFGLEGHFYEQPPALTGKRLMSTLNTVHPC